MNKIMKQQQSKSHPKLVSGSIITNATSNGFRTKSGMTEKRNVILNTVQNPYALMTALAFAMSLTLSTVAMSADEAEKTCNGGDLLTTNAATDTDKGCTADTCKAATFCKSKKIMNWWSAWAWCKSQNREMVELSEMCPEHQGDTCPALNKPTGFTSGNVWSKTPAGNNSYYVILSSGAVSSSDGNRRNNYAINALCK